MAFGLGIFAKDKITDQDIDETIKDFLKGRQLRIERAENYIFIGKEIARYDGYCCIFSGEIHNREEIEKKISCRFPRSKDDAEAALFTYLTDKDLIYQLKGIYFFGITDGKKHILVNDSFGLHPTFVHDDSNYFVFCSEYTPIANLKGFQGTLNKAAVIEYYSLGFVTDQKTFYNEIHDLESGSCVEISGKAVTVKRYDSLKIPQKGHGDLKKYAADVSIVFRMAAQYRLKTCRLVQLTGGIDTRLILCAIPEYMRKEFTFVTIKGSSDVEIARTICDRLGLRHVAVEPLELTKTGLPEFEKRRSSSAVNAISGSFGGELLGGQMFDQVRPDERKVKILVKRIFNPDFVGLVDPYSEYLRRAETSELVYLIKIFLRSFYSAVYPLGSRGGRWFHPMYFFWADPLPYVFLYEDLLRELASIPKEFLCNYRLYSEIMTIFDELNDIPTNSAFAKAYCLIPRYPEDITHVPVDFPSKEYNKLRKEVSVMRKAMYRDTDFDEALKIRFLDFESWLKRHKI